MSGHKPGGAERQELSEIGGRSDPGYWALSPVPPKALPHDWCRSGATWLCTEPPGPEDDNDSTATIPREAARPILKPVPGSDLDEYSIECAKIGQPHPWYNSYA
jgi:hypothetical protein